MVVSLVLPCYHPPEGWEQRVCGSFNGFVERVGQQVELVVVIDGAMQSITEEQRNYLRAKIPAIKIIEYPVNRGKGYAIRQGVRKAAGDIILYTDIDFPYTQESMLAVYGELLNGDTDIAVGVKDESYYSHVPFLRRAISKYLRSMIKIFLSMPITDTQCGLKGFRKGVAPLFLETTIDRYLFDLEFIRNSFKSKKFKVKAIPVVLNENVHFRSMNYRILLPEMINFIKLLWK
jgi:glycosyltransferase involved in cell wall biosynthesis